MPYPHDPTFVPDVADLDKLSLQDRLNDMRDKLTPDEVTVFESFLAVLSGAKLEDGGFSDMLRVWALSGYSIDGLVAALSLFKLRGGQSAFARRFFKEAVETQNLSYVFTCPVSSLDDKGHEVEVTTSTGQSFRGRCVICTIPLNVLGSVSFSPALGPLYKEVVSTPHVNKSTKVHAEVQPSELRTWMGMAWPENKLFHAAGEAITPAGNARLVCFGGDSNPLQLEEDIEEILTAVRNFHEKIEVRRLVFHNWGKDEYSRGGWSYSPPGMAVDKNLGVLREPHGNVHFASGDWATGWKGFIDGGIEEGTRTARVVKEELGRAGRS
jgi:monoamine oxidase